ncbi:endo alpha-1,4 polygalactosaminidase [Streptomyces sp. WAC 00631]|uniref:endo alpha-1,4 polygalactosaminidase n=1 Tax=Streptomyces sp. WAC 00631 TaxID=2203201 RepID=UPI000F7B658A|nr:endo alpha-1,4 polygalactosaminidase [Streptomyces sp. WAC 00631]
MRSRRAGRTTGPHLRPRLRRHPRPRRSRGTGTRTRTRTRPHTAVLTAVLLLLAGPAGCSGPGARPPADGSAPDAGSRSPSAATGGEDGAGHWRPKPGTPWQWQLSGRVDTSVDVPVYDIDGFENDAETVDRLHADGRKVICYINAGAWEDFRPDRDDFPRAVRGRGNGWPGERWLDIRRTAVLRPLMARRMDMCRDKGFDAVEPDLMDGYLNRTGFPLTARHQLAYNRMLAELAHERGLAVGLKNDLPQIPELVGSFDFAVNEECAEFGECAALTPFVEQDKAVFHAEYALDPDDYCAESERLRLSSLRKKLSLDAWRRPCP